MPNVLVALQAAGMLVGLIKDINTAVASATAQRRDLTNDELDELLNAQVRANGDWARALSNVRKEDQRG